MQKETYVAPELQKQESLKDMTAMGSGYSKATKATETLTG